VLSPQRFSDERALDVFQLLRQEHAVVALAELAAELLVQQTENEAVGHVSQLAYVAGPGMAISAAG
jgi:hypothetical protein